MKETERIPAAILGAGGYIGQHFVRLLADHPRFGVSALVGGERSVGRRLRAIWQLSEEPPEALADEVLRRRTPAELARSEVRLIFSALPSGTAFAVERECVRRGLHVFSNAADHRFDPDVPLLVPEVNATHLVGLAARRKGRSLHVANPNCTATGLVLALAPVQKLLRLREVHVATYQALSGAGFPGVPSLAITDNVVPFIAEEEEKVGRETNRILGSLSRAGVRPRLIRFLVHCARVAVRDGHLEAVTVVAGRRPSREELVEAWTSFDPLAGMRLATAPHPPLELRPEEDRPQPLRDRWAGAPLRARGMAAVIGRVRWEPPHLRLFVLSHNAVRGGAGGSVLNAELADAKGLLAGRGKGGPS